MHNSFWRRLRRKITAEWVTAVATIAAIVIGVWSATSHLAKSFEEATRQNLKLSADLHQAQIIATRQQKLVNDALASILNADSRAITAHSNAIAALLASSAAEQRVADLMKKASSLQQNISQLRIDAARVAESNAKAKVALREAQVASDRLVDSTVAYLHDDRYVQFVNHMGQSDTMYVPTSESVPENGQMRSLVFMFKNNDFGETDDKRNKPAFVADNLEVDAMEYQALAQDPDTGGVHSKTTLLDANDPRVKKFAAFLGAPAAINFRTSSNNWSPPPNSRMRVIDLLKKQYSGRKYFTVGFIPGKIGNVSYEDSVIRLFWITGVSASISRIGNATRDIRWENPYEQATTPSNNPDSYEFNLSAKEWKAATKYVADTFSPSELAHLQKRMAELDERWVQELSTGRLEFRFGQSFKLDATDHAPQVFRRWDWNAPLTEEAVVFFDTVDEANTTTFTLACAGAQFLEENHLSSGPESPEWLDACRGNGTGLVPGGRLITFIDFEMPNGATLPFTCDSIDGIATAPDGFRYEFHPVDDPSTLSHAACSAMVLLPDGKPVTISAAAPGYVGRPNSSPPAESSIKGLPVYGWTNPTTFNSSDKDNAAKFRSIEMDKIPNGGLLKEEAQPSQ